MKVWYQLYYQNSDKQVGADSKVPVESDAIIDELKDAVKTQRPLSLRHVDSNRLKVYAPGTDLNSLSGEAIALDSWKPVPTTSTGSKPFIVTAPTPPMTVLGETDAKRPRYDARYPALTDFDPSILALPQDITPPTIEDANVQPPFTSTSNWLSETCNVILKYMKLQDGLDRIPPMGLVRCSQGGKTRSLYEIAKELRACETVVLFVTFNDFSSLKEWEQEDTAGALYRRIAFAAALQGRDYSQSREQYKDFQFYNVKEEDIIILLRGINNCVLLIDDLNLVSGLGPSNRNPTQSSISEALKEHFLVLSGRYFVFTSHVLTTEDYLGAFMDYVIDRGIVRRALPIIPTLKEAMLNLGFADLNSREAIFDGLLPSLLYTDRNGMGPTDKRSKIVKDWINELNENGSIIIRLLGTMVNGRKNHVPDPLLELMDATDEGKVRWIPYHMTYVLEELKRITSGDLKKIIWSLVRLFDNFRNAKTASGDGWEALFLLVLLVRVVSNQDHAFMGLEDLYIGTDYKVSYNEPFYLKMSVTGFLEGIPDTLPDGHGPHVAVYCPAHSKFELYDAFLVVWDGGGNRRSVVGYQLKEGKSLPDQIIDERILRSYVVRGVAPNRSSNVRSWVTPSDEDNTDFFGVSGKYWTPQKWKELMDSK